MSLDPSTFTVLLHAGAVRSIGIVHRGVWWEVWVRVGQTLAESASLPIHATQGGVRQWDTFEAAYAFVRDQGYRDTVAVDDALESAGDRTSASLAAGAATACLSAPQEAARTGAGSQTPQGMGAKNARSPLVLTTPPKQSTTRPPKSAPSTPRPLSGPHRSTRPGPRPAPKGPQGG